MLDRYFGIAAAGSTPRTEVVAGITTFLTMAYIVFVNPQILAAAGMDQGAVFVATCLAAAYGSLAMGLFANYPVATAPGMGLNAFFAFVVVKSMGLSFQTALAGVFVAGVFFVAISGPLVPKLRVSRLAGAVLDGVTVASLALMAVVTLHLARAALVDLTTWTIAAGSLAALLWLRVNSAWLMLAAAALGWVLARGPIA